MANERVKGDFSVLGNITGNNLSGTNTGDQSSSDFDHDSLQNTHDLTTDIDHDQITNTHNLSTDIDHDELTNTHNLTTDIDHNQLTNYDADRHIDWKGATDDFATTGSVAGGKDKIYVRNDSGGQLDAFKVLKVSGDYGTTEIPKVEAISALTEKPIGILIANLSDATTGTAVRRGRYVCTGFDTSGATIGDLVYCDESGDLTLTPTSLEVGQVLALDADGVVYFNIGGSGSSSTVSDNQRLSAMDIDGVTNAIDTDKALYTVGAGDYVRGAKVTVCNRNGGYTAKIRIAHIDGAIGDIADEDYILYDDYLLPYETKIIEIDGLIPTDTILVRSNITDVNFIATGEVLTSDTGVGRMGAIEIDGSTKTVDTDYEVYIATADGKYNVLICNRNAGDPVEVQLAIIDSDDVADIADEDRMFFSLDNSQTVFVEGEFNLAIDEMIAFRSDTADVNCIVYRVE